MSMQIDAAMAWADTVGDLPDPLGCRETERYQIAPFVPQPGVPQPAYKTFALLHGIVQD